MKLEEKKELVTRSVSIYDVLNVYAPRKITANGMCCCPIHNEKHPSFKIYDRNRFCCFACGKKGDVLEFAMALFSIDFKSAVDKLSADFGLNAILSEDKRKEIEKKQREERERRKYEQKQKQLVRYYTDKLSDLMIMSRKKCSYWFRKSMLTNEEMKSYADEKNTLREAERIYMELNHLSLQGATQKTSEVLSEHKDYLSNL